MHVFGPCYLETDRLILRQFLETDWRDLHDYYSDAAATRYTVGRAFSEGETWRTLCTMEPDNAYSADLKGSISIPWLLAQ